MTDYIITDTNPTGPGQSFPDALKRMHRERGTPLFLQVASSNSPYGGMISDHEARHRAYCEKWGYEYRVVGECKSAFDKLQITLDAMKYREQGTGGLLSMQGFLKYSHVFIIDADAVVIDFEQDMRGALPSWAFLGLVTHPYPMLLDVWHWNVGCSFWQNTPQCVEFLTEVMKAKDRDGWNEQAEINLQLMNDAEKWQSGFVQLSRHWNNNWHDQPHDEAIVMAWHGYLPAEQRRIAMQVFANGHPWPES